LIFLGIHTCLKAYGKLKNEVTYGTLHCMPLKHPNAPLPNKEKKKKRKRSRKTAAVSQHQYVENVNIFSFNISMDNL